MQSARVLYILLCLTMGLVLLVTPWIPPWTNNYFVAHYTWIETLARNDYVRGAVSGLGLADLGLGVNAMLSRRRALAAQPGGSN
ncbi:MAG TPA: hypothetical protein VL523_05100 [Terriglobia bacterium]|nr:hypothetical protein [Terriglobia bacterium]